MISDDVIQIIKDIDSSITISNNDQNLLDYDIIDSLGIFELTAGIEDKYEIEIQPEDIIPENYKNINSIVRLVEKYTKGAKSI